MKSKSFKLRELNNKMIKRKKCNNCKGNIKSNYSFCPTCGLNLKTNKPQDWGMLGKDDSTKEEPLPNLFGGLGGKMMNKMIGNAMKMIEKEITKGEGIGQNPNQKIRLMINGKEVTPLVKKEKDPNIKTLPIDFSSENLKDWSKLKKKEPKTEIKRLDNKIVYAMKVPGVKTIKDISIVKLESGIEIKAISDKNAYIKKIPVDLPLSKYTLLNEILKIELNAN